MQQKPLLLIDSRHTLYDSRSDCKYKYNGLLSVSFANLAQQFQVLVLFCHNKPHINQFYFAEFQKHHPKVESKILSLTEINALEYDQKVLLITHDYKSFKIKSQYQLCYFSSLQQGFKKKQQLELEYYEGKEYFHISHIEQAKSLINGKLVVGYYFYPKKHNELLQYKLLIGNENVHYLPVDFRFQNIKQHILINVLFHKIMDIYKSKEINLKKEEITLFQENYNRFVQDYPNVGILDQIDRMPILIQRDQLNEKLSQLLEGKIHNIHTPKQIVFDNRAQHEIPQLVYPVIVKSKQGALTHNCHIMAIVVNDKGFQGLLNVEQFKDLLIIQEIINHDSTIYKIYQLGTNMIVQKRFSIPNIQVENFKFDEGFHVFDTQKDLFSNVSACLKVVDPYNHVKLNLPHEPQLYTQFEKLSRLISEEFHLQLFGFDIIGKDDKYHIIDINHFPGYKNVDRLQDQFESLFVLLNKK